MHYILCYIFSSLCATVPTFHTDSLSDCNGVLVDVNSAQGSVAKTYNSTTLFSLSTFSVSKWRFQQLSHNIIYEQNMLD